MASATSARRPLVGRTVTLHAPSSLSVGPWLLGHVDKSAVVALEGYGDGRRWSIAVLGDNEVRLAGAGRFFS